MKIYIIVFIVLNSLMTVYSQNSNINALDIKDSLVIEKYQKLVYDYLIGDVPDIRNSVVDSSSFVIIGDKKLYSRKSLSRSITPYNLVQLLDNERQNEKIIIFTYIFDYLFQLGLDLNYDYDTDFLYDENTKTYTHRFKTPEYITKRSILDYFLTIDRHYKYFVSSNFNGLSDEYQLQVYNVINYGNLKFPISCKNVLLMENRGGKVRRNRK